MKKSAFTLIELLVVISIIAILASIAVPVFSKAVERGKAANCAANLRQLAIGTVAYLNENEDQMFGGSAGGGGVTSWPVTLHAKYVQNWKVFKSPFDSRPERATDNSPVTYGLNQNAAGVNTAKFVSASELILFAPAVSGGSELSFAGTGSSNPMVLPGNGPKSGTHNNRSQINVAYADAHAGSISARDFSDANSVDGSKRWLPEGQAADVGK